MKNATKTVSVVMALLICTLCFAGCGINSNGSGKNYDSLKTAEVGDYIVFGSYEQDNNIGNGKEDIEWLVLAKEGAKMLVISRYALDCKKYNSSKKGVTWEDCSLRKWLNGTFIGNAFTSNEQNMIQSVTVTADNNPEYGVSPGNNTTDKVFLLSILEANKYFSLDSARPCKGTAYCYAQGAHAWSGGNCWWWLRNPGESADSVAGVNADGGIDYKGHNVDLDWNGVRPAMWIEIGSKENLNTDGEETVTEDNEQNEAEKLKTAKVGDYIVFGSYEQDNNTSNGKEDIEWLVLAKEGNKALLISKYALDCQQYNTSYTDVTWETCSIRKWLNGTFIGEAFSSEEQNNIMNTTVTADQNPSFSISPGNPTTDKLFLLSITEANNYFGSDNDRQCSATEYAKAQGAYSDTDEGSWWLRSPGLFSSFAASVRNDGYVYLGGGSVSLSDEVRPAMWINLGS